MKKIIVFILLSALCMSMLCVGCSKKPEFEFEEEDDDTVNFFGTTFTLMSEWAYEFKDKPGYTATVDRQLQRYDDIEKATNCHVNIVHSGDGPSLMLSGSIAGRNVTDLLDTYGVTGYDLYKANILYAIDEVPGIDPESEKWGPEGFRAFGRFGGRDYGFINYYWENVPQFNGSIFFNCKLGEELGLADPHEFIEKDEWTWATFTEQLASAKRKVDETEYYGLEVEMPEAMCQAAIFSNGGSIVKQLDNGVFVSNLLSDENIAALEFVAGLAQKNYIGGKFTENTAPYFCAESHHGTLNSSHTTDQLSVTMEKFALLNFPYGPSGSPESVGGYLYFNRRLFFFSTVTFNPVDEIGIFTDMLFEPLPGSPDDGWRSIAGEQFFHFDQDFDTFVYCVEHCNNDYSIFTQDVRMDLVKVYNDVLSGDGGASVALSTVDKEFSNVINTELNGR